MKQALFFLLAGTLVFAEGSRAFAQETETGTVTSTRSKEVRSSPPAWKMAKVPEPPTPSQVRTEKREKPNMDGREAKGPDAGEVLIWIPRVLLAPVHLVFEWGIRKPLGELLTVAERDRWSEILVDFFTFEERKIGIIPTFFLDFNFRPSVGLYLFWNEIFVKEHSIRLSAGYGGERWLRVTFVDRWEFSENVRFEAAFNFWRRPDYIFTGIGLEGDPDNRSRYFLEYIEGAGRLVVRPWRRSEFIIEAGVRQNRFDDGSPDDDEVALTALFGPDEARPEGFDDGYVSNFQRILGRIDSRESRPKGGGGVLVEGYVSHGWDMENPTDRQWLGYGGRLGGFLDLGRYKVLGLIGQVHFVNPLFDARVPFTELFVLSRRPQDLSGFLPGTLIGRSATVLTLEYTYPVWVFIDGALQLSVGNAFARDLEDFDVEKLRGSIGIGFKGTQDQDNQITFLFALGTSRFDEAFAIDSIRVVFGTQTGF